MAENQADATLAPTPIVSMVELKNGNVYLATEAKVYQLLDGKLRPLTFADVEHEAVMAGSPPKPIGAVPSAAPPPVPPPPPPALQSGAQVPPNDWPPANGQTPMDAP